MTACNKFTADELCTGCQKFFNYVLANQHLDSFMNQHASDHLWHHNTAETIACAAQDCFACSYVVETGTKIAKAHTGVEKEWPLYYRVFEYLPARGPEAEDRILMIHVLNKSASESSFWPKQADASPLWDALIELRQVIENSLTTSEILASSTDSDETHEKIKQWIRTCEGHDFCQKWPLLNGTTSHMPKRLLEMNKYQVRLIEGSSLPETAPYATLSYCWGGRANITLRTDTRDSFLDNIPWISLPRTFRDALTTAARLGYAYLWIDALCIMQDSLDDWEEEAANMCRIYANAAINISADDGFNSDEGLYRKRDLRASRAFVLKSSSTWLCMPSGTIAELDHSETNSRSWIVQERFLARGVAHFAQDRVFWECACMFSMENLSGRLNLRQMELDFVKILHASTRAALMRGTSSNAIYALWDEVSRTYSKSRLTKASDRAIAISGVARAICHLLRCSPHDYYCGVWRQRFVEGIMWSRFRPGSLSEQYQQLGFPSWSWYSAEHGHHAQSLLKGSRRPQSTKVLQVASLVAASACPFIAHQMPPVKIRAPLCAASIHWEPEDVESFDLGRFYLHIGETKFLTNLMREDSPYIKLVLDEPAKKPKEGLFEMPLCLMLGEVLFTEHVAESRDLTCQRSSYASCNDLLPGAGQLIVGHLPEQYNYLVLQPTCLHTFKRIGHLRIEFVPFLSDEAAVKQNLMVFNQQFRSPNLPEEQYASVDDEGMYAFSLA